MVRQNPTRSIPNDSDAPELPSRLPLRFGWDKMTVHICCTSLCVLQYGMAHGHDGLCSMCMIKGVRGQHEEGAVAVHAAAPLRRALKG